VGQLKMVKSLILWDGGSITVQITVSNDVDVIPHCNKFNQNTIIFLKKIIRSLD
jgi:hypothetical protein